MSEEIFLICGDDGNITDLDKIGNDPNFVFTNDPNFETIVLMNSEGKIINVNSWIECANYVNGGWFSDKIDLINGEKLVLYTTIILLIIHFISSKFSLKRS